MFKVFLSWSTLKWLLNQKPELGCKISCYFQSRKQSDYFNLKQKNRKNKKEKSSVNNYLPEVFLSLWQSSRLHIQGGSSESVDCWITKEWAKWHIVWGTTVCRNMICSHLAQYCTQSSPTLTRPVEDLIISLVM